MTTLQTASACVRVNVCHCAFDVAAFFPPKPRTGCCVNYLQCLTVATQRCRQCVEKKRLLCINYLHNGHKKNNYHKKTRKS